MKALITAGGRGTRLRPITHTSNKHLIPIANKPMIYYALEAVRDVGIDKVGIIVNRTRYEIENVVGNGSDFGLSVTYIEQPEPLGLAHCLMVAESYLAGESFVFYLGDNILAGGIKDFASRFESENPDALLLLSRVPDPERFGVPVIKDDKIIAVEEKPENPKSDYAVTGIYFCAPSVWEAVSEVKPSARGEYEIPDVFTNILKSDGTVLYENVTGWWKDTGKPEDLLAANQLVLGKLGRSIEGYLESTEVRGSVRVGKGSKIVNSTLRGPLVIGEKVRVEDSYIGPYTSISSGAVVTGSELENSVVMENAEVINLPSRLDGSLIGKEAIVSRGLLLPRTFKMVVGDHSRIDLV